MNSFTKNLRKSTALLIIAFAFTLAAKAESVDYLFDNPSDTGYVASGVPAILENGALKFTIDDANKSWKAKLRVAVNKDVFAKPVMKIRYRVGTAQVSNSNLAVILKIDDRYNKLGDIAPWRIFPAIKQTTTAWQELTVDLKPLITSWERTLGTTHGNIQEVEMIIGTGSPNEFTGKEFYIDYIKIGETLGVDKVELNPTSAYELLANLGVPVTGTPTISNFTVTKDGVPLTIDNVLIRDEKYLVIKLTSAITMPRDPMKKPVIKVSYNGNDAIKDLNNLTLSAFQKDLSYSSFASSMWKFWGKYENKVFIPYKSPWVTTNTVADGWDWSLPENVKANDYANFKYKNLKINTPQKIWCNSLNDIKISWNDLEPEPGKYRFDSLEQMIIDKSVGYDGVTVRLSAAVWEVLAAPGEVLSDYLKEMRSAPRWMDTMAIAKIRMNGSYVVNMDIMNPEYHNRYVNFITALGKTNIPKMAQLKIVNVCYRSSSWGEEFTPYKAENNAVEAQYSTEIVKQRTQERLKAWADAFGSNAYKLMYVGYDSGAQIQYAGEVGIGSRNGFIEMYNSTVQMSQFGMNINADRYVDIDENNNFIKRDVAFGDENEEYVDIDEGTFGWRESFPYRYYITSFRMLQMRRNYVMHAENTLNPQLTWYVGMGLARRVENTPDAFCLLSEFYISKSSNGGNAGAVKNIERWLYQRDLPGYITTPAMKVPTAKDLYYADNSKPYDFTARKGKKMGFDIDNRMFPAYENATGIHTESVVTTGADKVRTATFFIKSTLAPSALSFDLELHSEEEVPVFFVRVVKTKEVYTSIKETNQLNNEIRVSPNPFNDYLKLESQNQDNVSYTITDLLGRKVAEGNAIHSTTINTGSWRQGVYFIKTNKSKTYKLIKE